MPLHFPPMTPLLLLTFSCLLSLPRSLFVLVFLVRPLLLLFSSSSLPRSFFDSRSKISSQLLVLRSDSPLPTRSHTSLKTSQPRNVAPTETATLCLREKAAPLFFLAGKRESVDQCGSAEDSEGADFKGDFQGCCVRKRAVSALPLRARAPALPAERIRAHFRLRERDPPPRKSAGKKSRDP